MMLCVCEAMIMSSVFTAASYGYAQFYSQQDGHFA